MKATTAIGTATVTTAAIAGFGVFLMQTISTLDDFSRTPATVDVTGASAQVTCDMTLTAIGGPLLDAVCSMVSPGGVSKSCLASSAVGNVWSCAITIDADSEQGIGGTPWTIEHVTTRTVATPLLFDKWTHDDILGLSLPGVPDAAALAIDVTSTTQDITPPAISAFSISPTSITPGGTVVCTVNATDIESGIQDSGCTFSAVSEPAPVSCLSAGADCGLVIPLGAAAGVTWLETNHFARDVLGNLSVANSGSSFTVAGDTCGAFAPDYAASNGWSSTQTESISVSTLTADFYARPSVANQNAFVALSEVTPLAAFTDAAMILRFNASGGIDVRNGTVGAYDCDTCLIFTPNNWYHFVVTANLTSNTYTVQVENCANGLVTIATNYGFRVGAPNASISYHAAWSSTTAVVDVDQMTWTPGACSPETLCSNIPATCGTPADGCGGTLDCDTPNGGTCDVRAGGNASDVCFVGACCAPDTTCNGGTQVCGTPPDGCGGTQSSCGACVEPNPICSNFVCAPVSSFPTSANTGITDEWCPDWVNQKTTYVGPMDVTVPGTVIEYKEIITSNALNIRADNVIVRCTTIAGGGSPSSHILGTYSPDGSTDTPNTLTDILIEDVYVTPSANVSQVGRLYAAAAAYRRLHLVAGCDNIKLAGGLVKDTFYDGTGWVPSPTTGVGYGQWCAPGPHMDATQVGGRSEGPIWIVGSNMLGPINGLGQCFIPSNWLAPPMPDDITIDSSYLGGGGYSIYLMDTTRLRVSNNTFKNDSTVFSYFAGQGPWKTNAGQPTYLEMLVGGVHSNKWDTAVSGSILVDGRFHDSGLTAAVEVGSTGQLTPIPVWTVSGFSLQRASCTQGDPSCVIDMSANASGNGTATLPPMTGSSPRWRYRCGLDATELWKDAASCDGLSSCALTTACDFQSSVPGTYTVKMYSEPGPGAGIRVSDHAELTFTVN